MAAERWLQAVALALVVCVCAGRAEEERRFYSAFEVDAKAFLDYYGSLDVIASEDWVASVLDTLIVDVFEELVEQVGPEMIERLGAAQGTTFHSSEELERLPLASNRWVDVASMARYVAFVGDEDRSEYAAVSVTEATPSTARLIASVVEDPGLPHFLLKLSDLSEFGARADVIAKSRVVTELETMESMLTHFTVSKEKWAWSCTGAVCGLEEGNAGIVQVAEVYSGYRLADMAARVTEGNVAFEHLQAACSKVGAALGQLHAVSSTRTVAGPGEPLLAAVWSAEHLEIILGQAERELGGKRVDSGHLLEEWRRLETSAGAQPVFSLIHGSPTVHQIILPNAFFSKGSAIHLAGWKRSGHYVGFERHGDDMLRRRYLGAPEIDFHVFNEDLRLRLLELRYYDDEIEEAMAEFRRSYCLNYHAVMDHQWKARVDRELGSHSEESITCEYPSSSFEEYCRFLARLQLVEENPERFKAIFPEFLSS